jgi:hypothetical protein
MKNRIAYLVIFKNDNKSQVYTDSRKVKDLMVKCENLNIFMFKNTSSGEWKDVYELNSDGKESNISLFEKDKCSYSELGCFIMENIAKAEWNSSIPYPNDGWHICSVCGEITNEISECTYCGDWVCWDCAYKVYHSDWDDSNYCTEECHQSHCMDILGDEYEFDDYDEDKPDISDFLEEYYSTDDLIELVEYLKIDDEELLEENVTNDYLIDLITSSCDDEDIKNACIVLFDDDFDDYVQDYLDGMAYINSLDPNDPADAWFFED